MTHRHNHPSYDHVPEFTRRDYVVEVHLAGLSGPPTAYLVSAWDAAQSVAHTRRALGHSPNIGPQYTYRARRASCRDVFLAGYDDASERGHMCGGRL